MSTSYDNCIYPEGGIRCDVCGKTPTKYYERRNINLCRDHYDSTVIDALLVEKRIKESRPSYYDSGPYETIKVIDAWGLNFNMGNAVKYISRYDKKGDPIGDIDKAIQYLMFERERMTRAS